MGGKMKHFKPEGWLMDTPENRAAFASSAALRDAYFEGRILEARALLCDKDHNLHVDLGCMEGIIRVRRRPWASRRARCGISPLFQG